MPNQQPGLTGTGGGLGQVKGLATASPKNRLPAWIAASATIRAADKDQQKQKPKPHDSHSFQPIDTDYGERGIYDTVDAKIKTASESQLVTF